MQHIKLLRLPKAHIIPISLAIIFTLIYAYYSIYRHLTFNTNAFDLGTYSQISFLYSQGLFPFSSIMHKILLADHFEPILWLLSPAYKLFPTPNTLLIIQALFVGLSSIPIYLIALDKLKNRYLSTLNTLGYLTSTGIISAIHFDFHTTTISVLPLSLMLYSWYFKKWRLYWVSLSLGILFKEDIPIFIFGLGIFQLLKKQTRIGISSIAFSLISFYLIKFQIMPHILPGAENNYIESTVLPFTSPMDLVLLALTRPHIFLDQIFNSPIKINTLDIVYRQFGF